MISGSFQIREDGDNIEEFWESVIIEEELLNTQEDMYYYALLQLYLLTLSPAAFLRHIRAFRTTPAFLCRTH